MKTVLTAIAGSLLFAALTFGLGALLALPTKALWNYLTPVLGTHPVTFYQAWALNAFGAMLFKSSK